MPLVLTVTNSGGAPATLYLMGRKPGADFQVEDSGGRRVRTLLRGSATMAALRLFPLDPGQSIAIRQTWDQRTDTGEQVTPGEYRVRAVLLTDHPQGMPSHRVLVKVGE